MRAGRHETPDGADPSSVRIGTIPEIFVLHASDLHIGRSVGGTGFTLNPFARGHDFELAAGLTRALAVLGVETARRNGADVKVVVSGDLTATGSADEFANAQTFLGSRWLLSRERPSTAGLALPEDRLQAVAGNHDHWGGLRSPTNLGGLTPPGYRPQPSQFRITPWVQVWRSQSGQLELHLYGLDSNAGMTGRNLLAAGRVPEAHFRGLEGLLEQSTSRPGVRVARAVLLHHSPSHGGLRLTLDTVSVNRLVGICRTNGISAVLCGHTHHSGLLSIAAPPRQVCELRSPATLQGPADQTSAGFLFHRVSIKPDGKVRWQTRLYHWAGGAGFVHGRSPNTRLSFDC